MSKTRFILREVYPFVCPDCKLNGMIDEEQNSGKVGIMCPVCGYHTSKQKVTN